MKKSKKETKRKVRWSSLPCPKCAEKGPLLEIQYGYLASEPDSSKFIVGGCVVSFNQPEVSCGKCGWSGTKEDLRTLSTPTVILTSGFLDAMNYANKHHAKQMRKAGNIAYISHPIGVAGLIIEARGDEDQAIGGLLHDVAEDCGGEPRLKEIKKQFGPRVETIVRGCSDSITARGAKKAPWRERKAAHIKHLASASDDILLVTAADKLHNARAIVTDLDVSGSIVWKRFNPETTPKDIIWYYEGVFAALEIGGVTSILLSPLSTSIKAMKWHANK